MLYLLSSLPLALVGLALIAWGRGQRARARRNKQIVDDLRAAYPWLNKKEPRA